MLSTKVADDPAYRQHQLSHLARVVDVKLPPCPIDPKGILTTSRSHYVASSMPHQLFSELGLEVKGGTFEDLGLGSRLQVRSMAWGEDVSLTRVPFDPSFGAFELLGEPVDTVEVYSACFRPDVDVFEPRRFRVSGRFQSPPLVIFTVGGYLVFKAELSLSPSGDQDWKWPPKGSEGTPGSWSRQSACFSEWRLSLVCRPEGTPLVQLALGVAYRAYWASNDVRLAMTQISVPLEVGDPDSIYTARNLYGVCSQGEASKNLGSPTAVGTATPEPLGVPALPGVPKATLGAKASPPQALEDLDSSVIRIPINLPGLEGILLEVDVTTSEWSELELAVCSGDVVKIRSIVEARLAASS